MRLPIAIFALTALAACGTKTPLILPAPQPKPPATVTPARSAGNNLVMPTSAAADDSNKTAEAGQ